MFDKHCSLMFYALIGCINEDWQVTRFSSIEFYKYTINLRVYKRNVYVFYVYILTCDNEFRFVWNDLFHIHVDV